MPFSLKKTFLIGVLLCIVYLVNAQDTSVNIVPFVSDSCEKELLHTVLEQQVEVEKISGLVKAEDRREPWFFYVVLFQMALLAAVKWFFSKQIQMASKSFLNLNLAAYQFREERGEGSLFKMLLNVNFIFSLALFCISAMQFFSYQPPLSPFYFFCIIVFLLSLVYLLKYLQYLILALLLPVGQTAQFFQFIYFAVMRALGVLFVPLNLLLYYSSQNISAYLFYLALLFIVLFLLFRIMRGFNISSSLMQENGVHFFLYICTLEILPVVLLVKFLSGFF